MNRIAAAFVLAWVVIGGACASVVVIEDSVGATSASATSSGGGAGGTIGVTASSASVGAGGSTVSAASGAGGSIEVPVPDRAVAYQIDVAHTGAQTGDTLMPPLSQRWSVDFGNSVSYPLIVDGRVFAVVSKKPDSGTQLYALDQATGAVVWGPVEFPGYDWGASAAYGGGRIFVQNRQGLLCAYDAGTGVQSWCLQPEKFPSCGLPPVAFDGRVHACASRGVIAVSQATGEVLWKFPFEQALWTSPSVSASGIYVSFGVHQVYDLDPATGTVLWNTSNPGQGIGERLTALFEGVLYERQDSLQYGSAFDATTGAELGKFSTNRSPAFHGGRGFFFEDNVLVARAVPAFVDAWSFTAPTFSFSMAPIVVNGHVYALNDAGTLYAFDEQSGAVVWSADVGEKVFWSMPDVSGVPLQALAAGGGALIVPVNHRLVAYW
ncbi:MAG: PQQ-binding-like beta-propeller repeat protein [Byssovorax sp.]